MYWLSNSVYGVVQMHLTRSVRGRVSCDVDLAVDSETVKCKFDFETRRSIMKTATVER